MVIDSVKVTAPMIVDRGPNLIVIEFLEGAAIEMDAKDALALQQQLGQVLRKRRSIPPPL